MSNEYKDALQVKDNQRLYQREELALLAISLTYGNSMQALMNEDEKRELQQEI